MNFPLKNEWRDFNFKRFENEEFHLNLGEMEGNLLTRKCDWKNSSFEEEEKKGESNL